MARLSIRIDFEPTGSSLGPGMAELLERVSSYGSIRKAAASMDMSYRKAWELIQAVEKTFDGRIVNAAVGGVAGGGTRLTELGEKLLQIYRHIAQDAERSVQQDLAALSALVRSDATPKRRQRRKKGSARNR